ncbi:uncharacterized protein [Nicotiana sylvestris]|nr:PREDICTED: uncharacterized protein LOC104224412 isoform X4 [Nicotiana sylvestris]
MMLFAKEMISSTTSDSNPHILRAHKKLRKVFKGAIGALDGTLVHAVIPANQQIVHRGRGKVIFEEEGEHEQVLDETNGPSWTTEDSQFMNNMREEIALQLMQGRGNA